MRRHSRKGQVTIGIDLRIVDHTQLDPIHLQALGHFIQGNLKRHQAGRTPHQGARINGVISLACRKLF